MINLNTEYKTNTNTEDAELTFQTILQTLHQSLCNLSYTSALKIMVSNIWVINQLAFSRWRVSTTLYKLYTWRDEHSMNYCSNMAPFYHQLHFIYMRTTMLKNKVSWLEHGHMRKNPTFLIYFFILSIILMVRHLLLLLSPQNLTDGSYYSIWLGNLLLNVHFHISIPTNEKYMFPYASMICCLTLSRRCRVQHIQNTGLQGIQPSYDVYDQKIKMSELV